MKPLFAASDSPQLKDVASPMLDDRLPGLVQHRRRVAVAAAAAS
jgi:hypothetical protein